MQKALSLLLAFIIITAFTAAILYLAGYVFNSAFLSNPSNALLIGLSGGLGGLLGPVIAAYISKLFSSRHAA